MNTPTAQDSYDKHLQHEREENSAYSIRPLISHLVRNNWDEIVRKSRRNCHAPGVDSIMLLESPGKTIRLFVATEYHNLHQNLDGAGPLTVAFHPHHCNITLHCVYGAFVNRTLELREESPNALNAYKYRSALLGLQPGFDFIGSVGVRYTSAFWFGAGDFLYMPADIIHTIGVSKGHRAAWLVNEGTEDPNYEPLCYSDAPLERIDMSGWYQPMSEQSIHRTLTDYGLL